VEITDIHRHTLLASALIMTTTVLTEMTEKNAHFTVSYGYKPDLRPYATSSSSGKIDYMRPPTASQEESYRKRKRETGMKKRLLLC